MPVERATTAFKERRLNCAQSVLHAFQPIRTISDDEILQAKGLGGGWVAAGQRRAPVAPCMRRSCWPIHHLSARNSGRLLWLRLELILAGKFAKPNGCHA